MWSAKVHSNLIDPSESFIDGLIHALRNSNKNIQQLTELIHGTTIVTNTLLERKHAKVGLLVTKGFKDILEIGRQTRPNLYNLSVDKAEPLIPRNLVKEIHERVSAEGEIIIPLDENDTKEKLNSLKKENIDSLAISLLFSFKNLEHEDKIKFLTSGLVPEEFVFLSSKLLPEFREYERTSTTIIASAVAPTVVSYILALKQKMKLIHYTNKILTIMHSGGGTFLPNEAITRPHTLIESGPAAGIISSAELAKILSLNRVVSFDMGGTTAKAGLILNGEPQFTTEYEVGAGLHHGDRVKGSGYPVRSAMIDIAEIGAGAGSIAWIDTGGHLKVGPQSAGADPGPACYSKGGKKPTVTDAHLILNHISPTYFLGGEMKLDIVAAKEAITENISKPMAINLNDAAQGIISIAASNMMRILKLVSVNRGYDPREFTLIAYGGAGPLYATNLSEEMSIKKVIIPRLPSLFSALGLLYADMSADFVETVILTLDQKNLNKLNRTLAQLRDKAEKFFIRNNVPPNARSIKVSADLRYILQNYELNIKLKAPNISLNDLPQIKSRFNEAHNLSYGHKSAGETIQIVNLRIIASKIICKPKQNRIKSLSRSKLARANEKRKVWLPSGICTLSVYRREKLLAGHRIIGPAIVEEKESTTLIDKNWNLVIDKFGNLIIDRK
jgi:N-methylhydantoinase A